MNSNGLVLYSDQYVNSFQVDLMSGFISAIYSFMSQTIFTNELDFIEVGGLRFVFDIHEIGENHSDLIFVILCDRTENNAYIKPKLEELKWKFLELYYAKIKNWTTGDRDLFDGFKSIEQEIINRRSIILDANTETALLKNFQKMYQISGFIIGAALLTQTGHVLISFIDNKLLEGILRTLEARFHAGFTQIQSMLTQEPEGILVLIGNKDTLTAVLFQNSCPLGTALILGENFAKELNQVLDHQTIKDKA